MENKWLDSVVENYQKFFNSGGGIVMDIGTRDGDDAEFLRQRLNAKTTYAFDANPVAVAKTKSTYPDFIVVETAVSDFNGKAKFLQVNSGDKNVDGCSSLDANKVKNEPIFKGVSEEIEVDVIRMDKFIEDNGLQQSIIDVIKVDIEGYSFECVIGFGDYSKNVKIFHLETEREATHKNHKNNFTVAAKMRELGFILVDVSYEWGQGIQDQVWVNTNLVDNKDLLIGFVEVSEN